VVWCFGFLCVLFVFCVLWLCCLLGVLLIVLLVNCFYVFVFGGGVVVVFGFGFCGVCVFCVFCVGLWCCVGLCVVKLLSSFCVC